MVEESVCVLGGVGIVTIHPRGQFFKDVPHGIILKLRHILFKCIAWRVPCGNTKTSLCNNATGPWRCHPEAKQALGCQPEAIALAKGGPWKIVHWLFGLQHLWRLPAVLFIFCYCCRIALRCCFIAAADLRRGFLDLKSFSGFFAKKKKLSVVCPLTVFFKCRKKFSATSFLMAKLILEGKYSPTRLRLRETLNVTACPRQKRIHSAFHSLEEHFQKRKSNLYFVIHESPYDN